MASNSDHHAGIEPCKMVPGQNNEAPEPIDHGVPRSHAEVIQVDYGRGPKV